MSLRLLPPTVLPSAARQQIQSQSLSNILGDASSLSQGAVQTPDGKTFANVILDRELHGADASMYLGQINNLANHYLSKYAENPFYAFTKQGKDQVRAMQQIVNDPAMKAMESIKKANDKEFERVSEKGLQTSFIFDDFGNIAVIDREEGRRKFVNPEEFDPNSQYALNIADDYTLIETQEGSRRRAAYDVDSFDEVMKNIRATVQGLGTDKWKEEYDTVKSLRDIGVDENVPVSVSIERETNQAQLNEVVGRLMNNGLSPTAVKTLKSHYFRMNPNELGAEGSNQRAQEWMVDQINRVARGERIETYRPTTKDLVGVSGSGGKSGQLDNKLAINQILDNEFGTNRTTTLDQHGNLTISQGHAVPEQFMKDLDNPIQDPDSQLEYANFNVETNPWFQVGDKDNIQVAVVNDLEEGDLKSGDYVNIPYDMIRGGAIKPGPKPGTIVYRYVDKSGKVISPAKYQEIAEKAKNQNLTAEEINQYTTVDPETNEVAFIMQPMLETQVMVPRKIGLFGEDSSTKETSSFLKQYGHRSTEHFTEDFIRHSGRNIDPTGKAFGVDDEVFVVDVLLPLSKGAAGGLTRMFGEDVLTEKDLNRFDNLMFNQLKSARLGNIGTGKNKFEAF